MIVAFRSFLFNPQTLQTFFPKVRLFQQKIGQNYPCFLVDFHIWNLAVFGGLGKDFFGQIETGCKREECGLLWIR